jgi:hypothetical protein
VRGADEILATLDAGGTLDGMPFMPEMLSFVGRRFPVYKRADKTCDTATRTGGRRLVHAVHLRTRCDGSGHGGCQAGCLIFWKEAWLMRADGPAELAAPNEGALAVALHQLQRAAVRPDPEIPGGVIYRCQATQVPAATTLLKWWDVRQYVRDVRSRNVSVQKAAFVLGRAMINVLQRMRGGSAFPRTPLPTKTKTPRETLDLRPGELVQVKSVEEIFETLDVKSRNRGLFFDVEMIRWCGGTYRVQARVQQIINEQTGRMMPLPNDCIILEGVACAAECSRMRLLCPREIHHYWREIWLRRVPVGEDAALAVPEASGITAPRTSTAQAVSQRQHTSL